MSALGHKRTFALQNGMSALPPEADMCGALGDVCFVPIADIGQCKLKHAVAPQFPVGADKNDACAGSIVPTKCVFL